MKKYAINELIDTAALRDAGLHPFPPHLLSCEKRWTSQFKMMVRLLGVKKAITEYFRQESQNSAGRLTSHE